MTMIEAFDAFTSQELLDIAAAAEERGLTIWQLFHDSVMNALFA